MTDASKNDPLLPMVTEIVVTDPGAGYSSTPAAIIKGHESTPLEVKLLFGKDLKTNGAIASIEVAVNEQSGKEHSSTKR